MKAAAATELKFEEVDSSNIAGRAYDPKRKVIVVRFTNGTAYEYPNCDERLWKDFCAAASAGKFLHAQLRPRAYKQLDDWK